ncbi:hypothetical protein FD01_GL001416 [Lacticaseibacillus manihotivorans DSM 13343 = JCM 12514]|uniref:Uncharacterized protein n=1 Tax=Lacticaseibacillus manihotivorans DSM 13343 = JCM 12514 TaxID=1423769 RepID=A0A0R1QP02_9LACO|nr:hypothetical protein FD01_GL001416 [Lacticaseibacillus manihotivorans DSM 13343 = JCM 12514]
MVQREAMNQVSFPEDPHYAVPASWRPKFKISAETSKKRDKITFVPPFYLH